MKILVIFDLDKLVTFPEKKMFKFVNYECDDKQVVLYLVHTFYI